MEDQVKAFSRQLQHLKAKNGHALNAVFKSPLRYPGGKQKAIAQIMAMFPPASKEYREPMVGGGSVFFRARSCNFAESYWINDKFKQLVLFWQVVQDPH